MTATDSSRTTKNSTAIVKSVATKKPTVIGGSIASLQTLFETTGKQNYHEIPMYFRPN